MTNSAENLLLALRCGGKLSRFDGKFRLVQDSRETSASPSAAHELYAAGAIYSEQDFGRLSIWSLTPLGRDLALGIAQPCAEQRAEQR